jgi:hypothetical protein
MVKLIKKKLNIKLRLSLWKKLDEWRHDLFVFLLFFKSIFNLLFLFKN